MEERVSRGKFIRLGAALGVGAAGASVLAACGGGDDSGGYQAGGGSGGNGSGGGGSTAQSTEASGGGSTEAPAASGERPIASASEVEAGSAAKFEDAGNPALLLHLENGDFVAYSAVCTHQQCTVGYRGGQLTCPCHGSIFDPTNGAEVVSGPARRPLPEIPVEVRDGEVYRA